MILLNKNGTQCRMTARLVLCCVLFCAQGPSLFAQNLVPNPSFELIDTCPQWPELLNYTPGSRPAEWFSFSGSPDYFNECVDTISSVPDNIFTHQYALHEGAYSGMWSFVPEDHREMIGAELITPLVIGETYYVSIHANAAFGGSQPNDVGSSNIGTLFTMDPYFWVYPMPEFDLRNYSQMYTAAIVTDTLGWTLISGTFVADSAYRYLVIGNHFENALTDTVRIGTVQSGFYYGWAYVVVDEVCVSPDPVGCPSVNGIEEQRMNKIGVFPNPAQAVLHISWSGEQVDCLRVNDVIGRPIWQELVGGREGAMVDVADWARGQYVLSVEGEGICRSFKFVLVE